MLERYGIRTPMESEEFKQHAKEVCIRECGVENNGQREDVKEKIKQTNMKRHGAKSFVESDEFKKKSQQTCQRKYQVDHILQSTEFRKRIQKICEDRYGERVPFRVKEIQEKAKTTYKKLYVDDENGKQLVNQKRRTTIQAKYGVNHQMELDSVKERIRERQIMKDMELIIIHRLQNFIRNVISDTPIQNILIWNL